MLSEKTLSSPIRAQQQAQWRARFSCPLPGPLPPRHAFSPAAPTLRGQFIWNHPLDTIRYNEYIKKVAKGIQAEIQQTKPFNSLEDEALVSLQRTADRLHWQFSEMLKPFGLSPTQFNALRILRGAGEAGRACSEIGERMINRDPDITRLIDRLERRGLVTRSREARDRRVITTRITPAGLELLRSLDQPVEKFNQSLLGHLGGHQLRALIKLLDAARQSPV